MSGTLIGCGGGRERVDRTILRIPCWGLEQIDRDNGMTGSA